MPLIHERTFRVRHTECDAYGHVNHAHYLRYMQESALDASAAAGYDVARYNAIGHGWLIYETDITYLRPLTYGDAVIVRTWVADFRRVRSRRVYALRHAETGQPVAEALTDWVYLETASGRPATIPPEMIAAFHPDGSPPDGSAQQAPPPEPFAPAPAPPPDVYVHVQVPEWRDIDGAQHVNNAAYLTYCENASIGVAAHYGWPMARMSAEGFGIVARRHRIEYKRPALLGDRVLIATWISDVGRSSALRHYTLTRESDGTLLARARVQWVWIDLARGRPIRIPPHFLADFAPNYTPAQSLPNQG